MWPNSEGALGVVELGLSVGGGGVQSSAPRRGVWQRHEEPAVVAILRMQVGALASMLVEIVVCVLIVGLVAVLVDGLVE